MLEDELSVSTRERDGVAIIDLVGDVTTFAEEKINSAYAQVTGQGAKQILLNCYQRNACSPLRAARMASLGWIRYAIHRQQCEIEIEYPI